MVESNPYEPPRLSQRMPPLRVAKRTIGTTAVIVLTPLAFFIACAASCGTWWMVEYDLYHFVMPLTLAVIAAAVLLLPPTVTLVAMIWWARREYLATPSQQEYARANGGTLGEKESRTE
jgi:hypothetical protein